MISESLLAYRTISFIFSQPALHLRERMLVCRASSFYKLTSFLRVTAGNYLTTTSKNKSARHSIYISLCNLKSSQRQATSPCTLHLEQLRIVFNHKDSDCRTTIEDVQHCLVSQLFQMCLQPNKDTHFARDARNTTLTLFHYRRYQSITGLTRYKWYNSECLLRNIPGEMLRHRAF